MINNQFIGSHFRQHIFIVIRLVLDEHNLPDMFQMHGCDSINNRTRQSNAVWHKRIGIHHPPGCLQRKITGKLVDFRTCIYTKTGQLIPNSHLFSFTKLRKIRTIFLRNAQKFIPDFPLKTFAVMITFAAEGSHGDRIPVQRIIHSQCHQQFG